jgi:hypothetical protein
MTAVGVLIIVVALTWVTAFVVVVHANLTQPRRGRSSCKDSTPTLADSPDEPSTSPDPYPVDLVSDERRHHRRWP